MRNEKLYFMGIGGTGMGSVAGLFHELGYQVCGSDLAIYPPMSEMLKNLKIEVFSPYQEQNLVAAQPSLVVVGNSLSRGNVEIEYALKNQISYTSFPELLGSKLLKNRASVVVSGTHGKTTTTSLIAFLLEQLGHQPGYLIGGVPKGKDKSFAAGKDSLFIIEGDEYDTSFFDKGPKFLHYCPQYLIINNIEYDHADIYKNVDEIYLQFMKLMKLVPQPKNIIANVDDPGVAHIVEQTKSFFEVTTVATKNLNQAAEFRLVHDSNAQNLASPYWEARFVSKITSFPLVTKMAGAHNLANLAMATALFCRLSDDGLIDQSFYQKPNFIDALKTFGGVKRRLDLLAHFDDIYIYEDFAHHPTAVGEVIKTLKTMHPKSRLLTAFEPKNASNRRNVFTNELAKCLALADKVFIGPCPNDLRIPESQRMNTKVLAEKIGQKALNFDSNQELLKHIQSDLSTGDVVVFMSSSSFDGIQHQLSDIKNANT